MNPVIVPVTTLSGPRGSIVETDSYFTRLSHTIDRFFADLPTPVYNDGRISPGASLSAPLSPLIRRNSHHKQLQVPAIGIRPYVDWLGGYEEGYHHGRRSRYGEYVDQQDDNYYVKPKVPRRRSSSIAVPRRQSDISRYFSESYVLHQRRQGGVTGGVSPPAHRKSQSPSVSPRSRAAAPSPASDYAPESFRPRTSSMPLEHGYKLLGQRKTSRPEEDEESENAGPYYRVRSFSITAKGVVNWGDALKSRNNSKSNMSVNSAHSTHSDSHSGVSPGRDSRIPSSTSTNPDSQASSCWDYISRFKVVMLGSEGVGKSALITQFMTSEYMCAYDSSLDDETGKKTISVLLDGEESELEIIDHPSSEMSVEGSTSTYDPDGYVIVYSIIDKDSYDHAQDVLSYLWKGDYMSSKAIILVANKTDLERSRIVLCDHGRYVATSYDCKFIETSAGINHNVDELLVGILAQIRLKKKLATDPDLRKKAKKKKKQRLERASSLKTHRLLGRLLLRKSAKSKSCEDLHVL